MKIWKVCMVVAVIASLQSASFGVIQLIYEEGPKTGQGVDRGVELTFKIGNFDEGTIYTVPGPAGYSGLPGAAVGGGVTTLDGLAGTIPATGAQALGTYPGANGGLEDTWGIGKITRIEDPTGAAVWTPGVKGYQLNVVFYGLQDFQLEPAADPTYTRISGVGLHVDIYSSNVLLDGTGGTGARMAGNVYPTVNDGAQVLELSLLSQPGFIFQSGVGGGEATEFLSEFNFTDNKGAGQAFLNITGGASMAVFGTDGYAMNAVNAGILGPMGYDVTADVHLQFTTDDAIVSDWLVESDDPMKILSTPVPEPLTMLGLFMGLGSVGAYIRKRRMS